MSNHCEAADFRPDEAWGSLPGRSAARIICLRLGDNKEARVEFGPALFHCTWDVVRGKRETLAHARANQPRRIRLWSHLIKIQTQHATSITVRFHISRPGASAAEQQRSQEAAHSKTRNQRQP